MEQFEQPVTPGQRDQRSGFGIVEPGVGILADRQQPLIRYRIADKGRQDQRGKIGIRQLGQFGDARPRQARNFARHPKTAIGRGAR